MSLRNTSKSSTKKTYPGASYNNKTNNNNSRKPFVLVKKTDISVEKGFKDIEKFKKRLNMVSFNIITSSYDKGNVALNGSPKGRKVQKDLEDRNYDGEYKIDNDNKDYFIWKNKNKAIVLTTRKNITDGYYFVLIDYNIIPNIIKNNNEIPFEFVIAFMMYNCLTIDYTARDKKYLGKTFKGHKMHFYEIEGLNFLKVKIKISEIQKLPKEFKINYLNVTLYKTPDESVYVPYHCAIFEDKQNNKTGGSLPKKNKNKRNTLRKKTLIKSMEHKIKKITNKRKITNTRKKT